ncbi:hypothetical protein FZEAL_6499 [Fusarium zealandicum]|uniref:WSC domain-containing protein n=1 Tax=Fusarium zealandicum TaxID=1053134 RepID=A0A8H4UHN7_9HYPO|nr:hypothetical protein FZEAL_6499 [Fusarium zealandicum]
MRFSLSTVVALGALQTFGVYAQVDQKCLSDCAGSTRDKAADYGCTADQPSCYCGNGGFRSGVSECGTTCGGAEADIIGNLNSADGLCFQNPVDSLQAAASSEASTPAASTTSEALSTTSEALSTTSEAASSTSAELQSSSVSVEPLIPTSGAEEPTTTPAATPATSSESASESASATEESSQTSAAAGADATNSSSAEEDESSGSGLSKAAQIGIGIGVTAAVLALLGVGLCLFLKRRNQQSNLPRGQNMAPMPPTAGGGRNYMSADQGSIGEKNGYEIEMMSHRYEDMLPRQSPRTMV